MRIMFPAVAFVTDVVAACIQWNAHPALAGGFVALAVLMLAIFMSEVRR